MQGVLEAADGLLDDAVSLRRRLHAEPELGLELPQTQAAVLEALDGLPLASVTTGTGLSSVVAVLEGEAPGPTVLLRGDMDALPMPEDTGEKWSSTVDGVMHACGHDAHTAMLAGAARLLSDRRAEIGGRVVFMFQPGEEGWGGASLMLDEGVLDATGTGTKPDFAFAIHQTPVLPSGLIATRPRALLASADTLRIVVTGRGGHASQPHQTCDPIPIACEIVTAIQAMITRRIDVFDPAVVTVAKIRAGTTNNVIPESAELIGTIRTVSERTRARVHEDLERLANGIAGAHGATATVEIDRGYPVTVNDVDAAGFVLDTAGELLGADKAIEMPSPVMGAEDWSYVLQQVPGAMAFLGTDPGGGPLAPNHSNRMRIDESAMSTGIATYAAVALKWLAEHPSR